MDQPRPSPGADRERDDASPAAIDQAQRMRRHMDAFLRQTAAGASTVRLPGATGDWVARGDGHFHLAPELFLQVSGWTQFRFPHGELLLGPGEALVLPPKLLHAEHVGPAGPGAPFCNIVSYAEGDTLTCHLAHEAAAGKPGIVHLETGRHAQAPSIQRWLGDAVRLGRALGAGAATQGAQEHALADAQARALVAAAIAGALRALDDSDIDTQPEPPLVARTRAFIQNQLGDQSLSVGRLAGQLDCTADYLSHLFSRSTGEHLAGYINRQRMERAAHLLTQTALAGKEVAWACGFASQSYFIRNFRAHYGMTPKTWQAWQRRRDPGADAMHS